VDYKQIIKEISAGNQKPVYFLQGDEPYFIDLIERFTTERILDEGVKGFDQTILYGKDTDLISVINAAKRYPMMGKLQIISVREAQHYRNFDALIEYLKKPQDQTLLLFSFKGKKLDKRILKKFGSNAVIFESKKFYDNQVPDWIINYVASKKLQIAIKSAVLLSDFLGNDLAKIVNEVNKLAILLPPNSIITPDIIEQNIGISKEYNTFELTNALINQDILKANRIATHFGANPKNYPLVITISMLYGLFSKIMCLYFVKSSNPEVIAKELGVRNFFLKDYQIGKSKYSKRKLFQIITLLNEYDLKSKGVGNSSTTDGELLKELIFKILH
jgi:DNA polymerase-3 subunit delta